ncbi:MAG: phosphatidylserine decarboxylase, partial [Methylovulum sp.]|nr:phosphatidylserine decarboxylase [Methylovulum sp.]
PNNPPTLQMGEEMGRFNMGSTIIMLFGKDKIQWDSGFAADKTVKLGEKIGRVLAG